MSGTRWPRIAAAGGGLVAPLAAASLAHACPGCAEAIEGTGVGLGINVSILFLIITPILIVAGSAASVAYLTRTPRPTGLAGAAQPKETVS